MASGMNFKSKMAYKKWLGFGHATGVFDKTPGNTPVAIKGKTHAVDHSIESKKARAMAARAAQKV